MTVATARLEAHLTRRRERWTMITSFSLHVLLLLWVMSLRNPVEDLPLVTEITLLEPSDFAAAAPSAPAPASSARQQAASQQPITKSKEDVRFRRTDLQGEISPQPQAEISLADRMASKLTALQNESRPMVIGSTSTPTSLFGTSPAAVAGTGTSSSAVKLTRGGTGTGTALDLSRGATPGAPAALTPAGISGGKSEANAPAKAGESTAQRTVAGVSLMGPVADRAVLFHSLPVYPEWAKREAVEGSVTLYFVVRPNGTVKENVLIQKTAGFGDFDENARVALRGWRFEPLKGGRTGEQWGTITFHFRIREAG
jgi:TonB family protein